MNEHALYVVVPLGVFASSWFGWWVIGICLPKPSPTPRELLERRRSELEAENARLRTRVASYRQASRSQLYQELREMHRAERRIGKSLGYESNEYTYVHDKWYFK